MADEIKKTIPNFEIKYEPDFRQEIADSWPASIDDSSAKNDWGLDYKFDISSMSIDMINNLKKKLGKK
ncbi:putative epimerase/dehydratase [compost metagenome]